MKILLLGKNGQLGWELERLAARIGSVTALNSKDLNLENYDALRRIIRDLGPELILNAAGYTHVDKAESEQEKVFSVNAVVPGILAEEVKRLKSVLIHYSTDYIFDGKKGDTYTERDLPNPLNVYGKSKLVGEQAIQSVGGAYLIFRTAWLYSLRSYCFVAKVLEWARRQETLRIVDDQISNPTWAGAVANITTSVIRKGKDFLHHFSGVYHLAGSGYTTRYTWAKEILALDPNAHEQIVKEVIPVSTSDFSTPAKRPLFSALDCQKFFDTFGYQLPDWKDALFCLCNSSNKLPN